MDKRLEKLFIDRATKMHENHNGEECSLKKETPAMAAIRIYNTFISIEAYEKVEKLEKKLQLWDEVRHEVRFSAYRVIENPDATLTMVVPRSTSIRMLEKMFPEHEIVYVKSMVPVPTVSIGCHGSCRNKLQEDCIEWMLDNHYRPQLLLHLRVGTGKTWLALKYIDEMRRLAAIIVDEEKTLHQWIERILEHTDLQEHEIGIVQGQNSFQRLMKNKEQYKILLGIHRTYSKAIERDPKSIDTFFRTMGVDIKVVDEAHVEMMSTFGIDCRTNVRHSVYLTGTAMRADWREKQLMTMIMPVNYAFGVGSENIKEGDKHHIIITGNYDSGCSTEDALKQIKKRGYSQNDWAEYTLADPERFDKLVQIVLRYITWAEQEHDIENVFIALKTLPQCQRMQECLVENGYSSEDIGQFNTLIKGIDERMEQLQRPIVISTEKSLGKALDREIDMIIDFVPTSNRGGILQISGRLRAGRSKGLFLYFYDRSIPTHGNMFASGLRPALKKIAKSYSHIQIDDI